MNPNDDRFLNAALAEDGMPITAGYRPIGQIASLANKDKPSIPVWGEIGTLPRWARVAFAARCARRVLSILQDQLHAGVVSESKRAGKQFLSAAVAHAVEVAETIAKQGRRGSSTADEALFAAADVAKGRIAAIGDLAIPDNGGGRQANEMIEEGTWPRIPFSKWFAEWQAREILKSPKELRRADVFNIVYHAAYAAHVAAHLAGNAADVTKHSTEAAAATCRLLAGSFTAAPAQDLSLLSRLAKEQSWTDDTPVAPEVFGPLWPEGRP